MAKGRGINLNLPSADDLFSTQEERDEVKREMVMEIAIEEISDFPDHPFKVRMDEEMQNLVESVRQYGVLSPALVRTKPEGGYEMVAGHRRKYASELAEKRDIPCIVRELSDEEATILMVDSNLQRETILPSEKAFAYKMKLDAMKKQQGFRTDLTSATVLQKSERKSSRQVLAEQTGESHEQIRKYIRLTNLIPELLELVDNSVLKEKGMLQIAMRPAVELSYLPKEEQTALYETIESEDCTPSHAQAIKMRQFSEQGRLNEDVIFSILSEEKGNQKEQFRMPKERISKFFPPGTSVKQVEDTIIKALEMYRKRERSRER
ncbi:MAG: ParB/RepB/Spo0J family partition protein [Lachnospiraceae bacterium]|nr:ParB/RepB/Spo0J family partition protein [Lachnospiraceae bacterium]